MNKDTIMLEVDGKFHAFVLSTAIRARIEDLKRNPASAVIGVDASVEIYALNELGARLSECMREKGAAEREEKAKQLNQTRTPRKADVAPPEGFTYLSDFCTLHHVPYQAAEELFPHAIRGQKIKVGRYNYPVIGPKGRHDFWVQLHTRDDYVTCDDCPHESAEG